MIKKVHMGPEKYELVIKLSYSTVNQNLYSGQSSMTIMPLSTTVTRKYYPQTFAYFLLKVGMDPGCPKIPNILDVL